jgi:hypothetical protein
VQLCVPESLAAPWRCEGENDDHAYLRNPINQRNSETDH